jgi:DNA-binding MarR family transcriptional regulator
MTGKLQAAIRQTRPFESLEAEAFLNLQRSADALTRGLAELLRGADLSPTQYNVLRILRGAGPEGLSCGEVGERMVTRDPDITRLLDRMERRGFVARSRERSDRRVIRVRITPGGLQTVNQLDGPVAALHRQQLGGMGSRRLRSLIDLLEKARGEGA